ncbi:hypothetical protein [Virgisporangium aurantiacum]|uniref:Uncharacterized protein n=1 Tax=Virgisporangium aurantiacum TaxID=175570 RepID=A0A8J3YZU4_9ACTN|nr:hypothetical protein [Virgisporangium aurantiacum]GIJ52716.1 hypothetical protein Vau01_002320 [Virgisporangium aurantiacum]
MLTGRIILESLRVGSELRIPGLVTTWIGRQDVSSSTAPFQPDVWTLLDFEAPDEAYDALVDGLSGALAAGQGWYADFRVGANAAANAADKARGDAADKAHDNAADKARGDAAAKARDNADVNARGDADVNAPDDHVVVYAGRVFRYRVGDAAGRAEAMEYGRKEGIPENQLDWDG